MYSTEGFNDNAMIKMPLIAKVSSSEIYDYLNSLLENNVEESKITMSMLKCRISRLSDTDRMIFVSRLGENDLFGLSTYNSAWVAAVVELVYHDNNMIPPDWVMEDQYKLTNNMDRQIYSSYFRLTSGNMEKSLELEAEALSESLPEFRWRGILCKKLEEDYK